MQNLLSAHQTQQRSKLLMFRVEFKQDNRLTKPIPLAEASLVQLPPVQVLVYSQETAHSFPHFKEKTWNTVKDDCRTS